MRTEKIGGKVVTFYDNLEELSIARFHKFNRALLLDAGVGGDISDIDTRLSRVLSHLSKKRLVEAEIELVNMRQAMLLVISEINPKQTAFAALVYSIDGVQVVEMTDAEMQRIIKILASEKHTYIATLVDDMRKKLDAELKLFFPSSFSSAKTNEQYDTLKKRTQLLLCEIVQGVDTHKEREALDDYMLTMYKPEKFMGVNNPEVVYDRNFSSLCALISTKVTAQPKTMTVLEFYTTFEMLKNHG